MALRHFELAWLAAPLLLGCGVSTMHAFEGDEEDEGGGVTPVSTTAPVAQEPVTPVDPSPECEGPAVRPCATTCGSQGTQRCGDGAWGDCEVPQEVCTNGIDDDCDGRVDGADPQCPPIRHTCEEEEGGGCNGDPGYGDRCAPADNTGGCSAARFAAWCNRRNPATPNAWYEWIITWVDSRCDGPVTHDEAQYRTYSCLDSSNRRYECTTPLVLQFGAGPVRYGTSPGAFAFTPGRPVETDWPTAATPWLVRDVDGDGRITSGREFFGGDTLLRGGRPARHGFEALAVLDENGDGLVDERDPGFAALRTWRDQNGDRVAQPRELRTLAQEGVTSLSLDFEATPRCDARRNCERERAAFTFVDATGTHVGALVDVYLRVGALPRAFPRAYDESRGWSAGAGLCAAPGDGGEVSRAL